MNYLQLCQELAEDVGVAGASAGTVPTTVVGQTGELRRIARWVRNAWLKLQGADLWPWMWEETTVVIAAGGNVTATGIPEKLWDKELAHHFGSGNAPFWMEYLPWGEFKQQYGADYLANNRTPTVWTIRRDNAFVVNAIPTADFTIHVERWGLPQTLVGDTDTPGAPEHTHQLIVQMAKVLYANHDEAGAMRQTAQVEVDDLMMQFHRLLQPSMRLGGALA